MRRTFIAIALMLVAATFVLGAYATASAGGSPKAFLEERKATEAALADAKARGAQEDCRMDYNTAAWKHHAAVDVFWSCRTELATQMMKEAHAMADALCGEMPVAEKTWTIEDANFDTAKADIRAGEQKTLNEVVKVMKANPELKFAIHGYTDSRGSDEYNMDLSKRRAEAVKKYLTDRGIDGKRLKTVAHGERDPIAPNYTDEGMAKNRRVEIRQIKEK